ncbi:MAG: hypothetical protein Q9212_007620, partial [Teloschistes hypoglaucus]
KEILLAAKHEVEANWKNSKWVSIAAKMEEKGAKKYPTEFIQKEFKKLEAEAAAAIANTAIDVGQIENSDAQVLLDEALEATALGGETEEEEEEEARE